MLRKHWIDLLAKAFILHKYHMTMYIVFTLGNYTHNDLNKKEERK